MTLQVLRDWEACEKGTVFLRSRELYVRADAYPLGSPRPSFDTIPTIY